MKGFAIHNAPTDHGGIIPSTQLRSSQEGNTFVRAGDGHFCPKCKCWSTVVKSNDHVIFDGKAVAFVGDSLTCGAKILYQQSHVVGDAGGGSSGSSAPSNLQPVNSQQNLVNRLIDDKKKDPCPPECVVKGIILIETTKGTIKLSQELMDAIVAWEGNIPVPYVPGKGKGTMKDSGVTLGIGYDLGQQTKEQIRKDLAQFYTPAQIERLVKVQGLKGTVAQNATAGIQDIKISKDTSIQMALFVKKRYSQWAVDIYPELLNLHPHCQGALLSLVFNRGKGLQDPPPGKKGLTRKHMRQISEALKSGKIETIPDTLRDMAHLWEGGSAPGLPPRRRGEADWFEKGMKCDCYE